MKVYEESRKDILKVLRFRLRGLSPETKEDAMQESEAIAWLNFLQLVRDEHDPREFAKKVAEFASRRVRSGRGLNNINPSRDIMSRICQYREEYEINSIPLSDRVPSLPEIADALVNGELPDDQAILNADIVEWLATLTPQKRSVAELFMRGFNQREIGLIHHVSRQRIAQIRVELWESYRAMFEE